MDLNSKSKFDFIYNLLCGVFIGFSIIIPGLNGSTIAVIMNVYDKIIFSLSNLNKQFRKSIFFLLPFIIGIIFGCFISFVFLKKVINIYPIYTISFFIGLMIGSCPIILKKIMTNFNYKKIYILIIGFIIPLVIIILSFYFDFNIELIDLTIINYIYFFIIGLILSITQLIPGISATVVLMIFGCYIYLLNNLNINMIYNNKLILLYCVILIGVLLGVIMFSKLINYYIKNKEKSFNYFISGLSISSIICFILNKETIRLFDLINKECIIKTIYFSFFYILLGFFVTFMIYLLKTKRCNDE